MICKELGYGKKARFLGNQEEYFEFLETHLTEGRKTKGVTEASYLKVTFSPMSKEYFILNFIQNTQKNYLVVSQLKFGLNLS